MGFIQLVVTLTTASGLWLGYADAGVVAVCKSKTSPDVNAMAAATTVLSLASALNQRNIYMKDVAGYKFKNNKPVEDLPREEKVMNSAVANASSEGLDPNSVRPFIKAQMDVAKNIQRTFIAGWKTKPEPGFEPKDLEDIRVLILAEDVKILRFIHQQLKLGGFCEPLRAQIYSKLTAPNLTDADRKLLVDTLFLVRLKTTQ